MNVSSTRTTVMSMPNASMRLVASAVSAERASLVTVFIVKISMSVIMNHAQNSKYAATSPVDSDVTVSLASLRNMANA